MSDSMNFMGGRNLMWDLKDIAVQKMERIAIKIKNPHRMRWYGYNVF